MYLLGVMLQKGNRGAASVRLERLEARLDGVA
jgi:hypothetical protein